MRHISQLGDSQEQSGPSCSSASCATPPASPDEEGRSTRYEEVRAAVDRNVARGVELWQANFKLTREYVVLERYHRWAGES